MRTKEEQNKKNRRILYLWFPYFSIERFRKLKLKGVDHIAMVLVHTEIGRRMIVSACPLAIQLGIVVGHSLSDALAMYSNLSVFEVDLLADKIELKVLMDWCGRYTPFVAVDNTCERIGDSGIWLDITGCDHLFNGEEGLLHDITSRLLEFGWTVRGTISDTPGSAWAIARYGKFSSQIVPKGMQQATIAQLPLAALRLSTVLVEDLSKVGLRKIGELISVPRAPLRTRFGPNVRRRLDQALGLEREPISLQLHHYPYLSRFILSDPVFTSEAVMQLVKRLLFQVIEILSAKSLGIRQLSLNLYKVDGKRQVLVVGTSHVSRNTEILLKLFFEKLNGFILDAGVDVVTLEATKTDIFDHNQASLDSKIAPLNLKLSELIDRLVNRFGMNAVILKSIEERYNPERSEVVFSAASSLEIPRLDMNIPRPLDNFLTVRPLRLIKHPERINPIVLCKYGKLKCFSWRNKDIQIRRINGPERIGPEWWDIESYHTTRDYFRVEDIQGRRYWLFKEFIKKNNHSLNWYLHGFFA